MGFLKSVKKVFKGARKIAGSVVGLAAPVIGGYLGGPAGAAAGSAISGFIGQSQANAANQSAAEDAMRFTSNQAGRAMSFEDAQALRQMRFQENMSNSAWQRGMEDMRKAGINPILAYQQGGASSPQGAMARGFTGQGFMPVHQSELGAGVDAFAKGSTSAHQLSQAKAVKDRLKHEIEAIKAKKWLDDSKYELNLRDAKRIDAATDFISQQAAYEFERVNSAQMANKVMKATLPSMLKKAQFASDSKNLMVFERILESIGRLLGPVSSMAPNVNIRR
jgi:hypothetical protein